MSATTAYVLGLIERAEYLRQLAEVTSHERR